MYSFFKLEQNLEEERFEIPEEINLDIEWNNLEDFEDEGHFHIFKRQIKGLQKKIAAVAKMIACCQGNDIIIRRKRAYLEQIDRNLREIAREINQQ